MSNKLISSLTNSEEEIIQIQEITAGDFIGQHVLVIFDDDKEVMAPHLLDEETRVWLMRELPKMS